MKPVESALLFVGKPAARLPDLCESLNALLCDMDVQFVKPTADITSQMVLFAPGVRIIVARHENALPAESFSGALDSPLSDPFRGILSDTLFRHGHHILVSVFPTSTSEEQPDDPKKYLHLLKIAHATTTLLAQHFRPAALHWRASNQLLTASQYAQLSDDRTPWVLFARARILPGNTMSAMHKSTVIALDDADKLVGRPILFSETTLPEQEAHALALSFLRHAVQSGQPIADGDTFGTEGGTTVKVRHVAPGPDLPKGQFLLSVPGQPEGSEAVPDARNRPSPATHHHPVMNPHPVHAQGGVMASAALAPLRFVRAGANAVSNAIAMRSGTIAAASVAFALAISAWTFLTYLDQKNTSFVDNGPITSTVLDQ